MHIIPTMTMLRQPGAFFGILSLLFCWDALVNAFQHASMKNVCTDQGIQHALFARHEDVDNETSNKPLVEVNRRSALTLGCSAVSMTLMSTMPVIAAEIVAPITHKVFMDVRISRSDGTFYVRDDLEDLPENKVFYGRLVFGLYGTKAPTTVERFLSYVTVAYNPLDDNPLPTYGRSTFRSLDQATGLLVGGYIPSLELTSFSGGTALQYGGRVFPAPLWIDKNTEKLPHDQKGLLTHGFLDVTPTFGITTRSAPELDSTHIVFGQVLLDDSSRDFLNLVKNLPTYSLERPMGDPRQDMGVENVAAAVFNSQREFFRGAAKTFGDTRLKNVQEGKLLRRVEVTQVGLL